VLLAAPIAPLVEVPIVPVAVPMLPLLLPIPPPVFEPGVLPGGLTVGEVVAFGSICALLGPAPPVGCIGWFWLLLVWANATPLARASAAPQSAKPLIDIWLFSLVSTDVHCE